MRKILLLSMAGPILLAVLALAQPLTHFYPGDAVTVSSHTVTIIFSANYEDRNRIIYSDTYDLAIASASTGVSCSFNMPVKKGVYLSFPSEATYAVYGLSCGAGDTTVFKAKDR